jgi:hypothetical protein
LEIGNFSEEARLVSGKRFKIYNLQFPIKAPGRDKALPGVVMRY